MGKSIVTPNHVYTKLGNGTIRDLTLDTNTDTVYTHPSYKVCNYSYSYPAEKQCNYNVDLSNYATKADLGASIKINVVNSVSSSITYTAAPSLVMISFGGSSYEQIFGPFVIAQGFSLSGDGGRGLYGWLNGYMSGSADADNYMQAFSRLSLSGTNLSWRCGLRTSYGYSPKCTYIVAFIQ